MKIQSNPCKSLYLNKFARRLKQGRLQTIASCSCDLNQVSRRDCLTTGVIGVVASSQVSIAKEAIAGQYQSPIDNYGGTTQVNGSIDYSLANTLLKSIDDAAKLYKVKGEEDMQDRYVKLRDQEFPYLKEANMDALRDIDVPRDTPEQLANGTYFNYVYYLRWKSVAINIDDFVEQQKFCNLYGHVLLRNLSPEVEQSLVESSIAAGGKAQPAAVKAGVVEVFNKLVEQGYAGKWQLTWGMHPIPEEKWYQSQDTVTYIDPDPDQYQTSQLPVAGETYFQVRLKDPIDIKSSVSLKEEQDGFWQKTASSLVYAVASTAGYNKSYVDSYFLQDAWIKPASLWGRLLLAIGDPLMQADVPFVPSSLVMDWAIESDDDASTRATPDQILIPDPV